MSDPDANPPRRPTIETRPAYVCVACKGTKLTEWIAGYVLPIVCRDCGGRGFRIF